MSTQVCKQRKSNIELLRILTMCGVIALHYNNSSIGGGFEYAEGINKTILYFIESLCIGSVNLFILISGYFLSANYKRSLKKPLSLIFEVVTVMFAVYLIKVFIGIKEFNLFSLCRCFIPDNYFVILYIVTYFISPIINLVLDNVDKKTAVRILIVLFIIFSLYSTLVDVFQEITSIEFMGLSSVGAYGSQGGYSAINFLFMYTCGAFLYKFDRNEANKKKLVVSLLIITILLVGWAYFNDAIGVFKVQSAWMYSNPLVIILAIVLFKLFNSINIGYSKIINELAKASFTVFLLQNYFLTKLNIKEFVQNNCFIMLGHILFSIVFIYLISYILFKIYNIFIEKVVILICNKITFINKDIYNNCFDGLN